MKDSVWDLVLDGELDSPLRAFSFQACFGTGAGACVQIFLFSVAAIELKRKAPAAHTFLERELRCPFQMDLTKFNWQYLVVTKSEHRSLTAT